MEFKLCAQQLDLGRKLLINRNNHIRISLEHFHSYVIDERGETGQDALPSGPLKVLHLQL